MSDKIMILPYLVLQQAPSVAQFRSHSVQRRCSFNWRLVDFQ